MWSETPRTGTRSCVTPEVTGVSPSKGSIMGGTLLTIHGRFFDQTDEPARVLVGGLPCEVQSVADDRITCRTAERRVNEDRKVYPGENRAASFCLSGEAATLQPTCVIMRLTSVSMTPGGAPSVIKAPNCCRIIKPRWVSMEQNR
ncbi:hypothetical protein XENOCAPTIV_014654 [Xenoophorus captivus]|uniref:IPT/TIG domain-containing protein n=1 Tax=Xenoophorus captivus TaxID=1517983 RepID=A0ABV0RR77_9TELE